MGTGPRTNLYRIGGDPLTQLKQIKFKKIDFFKMQSSEHSSLSTALVY